MKRFLCVLLSVLLLCSLFAGCEREPEKLRICFDLGGPYDLQAEGGESSQEHWVKNLMETFFLKNKVTGGPGQEDVEIEIIPSDLTLGTERSATLQRLRTEIMTGEGPDVFVCCTEGVSRNSQLNESRLFSYVGKAMEEYFLPLDDYLGNFSETDWNDLYPQLMAGGKNSDGQQMLLPMRYSIPSLIYRQQEAPAGAVEEATREDLLTATDPALTEQFRWSWNLEQIHETGRTDNHLTGIPFFYPRLADASSGTFVVTEEEMTKLIWDQVEPTKALLAQEPTVDSFADFPDRFWFDGNPFHDSYVPSDTVAAFFPTPNCEGGATAVVYSYCAVNRNSGLIEEAISFLDCILCEDIQMGYGTPSSVIGMPVNKKAMVTDYTLMNNATMQEWEKAVQKVNLVHFPSPLNTAIDDLMKDVQIAMVRNSGIAMDQGYARDYYLPEFWKGSITEEELSSIVHTHYEEMQRLLDES